MVVNGGHIGFMQITRIAQSCQTGNQAEFFLGPLWNTNLQKKFIGQNISRFGKRLLDYLPQDKKRTDQL